MIAGFDILWYAKIVNIAALRNENPKVTSFMRFREKQWKAEGAKKRKISHVWVNYSQISKHLITAVILAEDGNFYRHDGFDVDAINHALEVNVKRGKTLFGGSTITQQLAKNLYLTPSKTYVRKINEAILTYRIEKTLTKKRIIELYLNCVEWGDGVFGIEAASRKYFRKPASDLTKLEAARLAVILPNPIVFDPVNPTVYIRKKAERIVRELGR